MKAWLLRFRLLKTVFIFELIVQTPECNKPVDYHLVICGYSVLGCGLAMSQEFIKDGAPFHISYHCILDTVPEMCQSFNWHFCFYQDSMIQIY